MTGQPHSPASVTPLNGWFLNRTVALDEASPGLAGHVLRASPERRQVVAAFLSLSKPHSDFRTDAEIGWFLAKASHTCILRAGFGSVPTGLRGALANSGAAAHPRRYYHYLYALMSSPRQAKIAKIISRMAALDPCRLRIIRVLPLEMRQDNLINHLESVSDAQDLRVFVDLLAAQGIDRDRMIEALAKAPSREAITKICRRWSFKARLPDHPIPGTDVYRPITTGDELRRAALTHRNCMRSYLANVLERRSSFAIVTDGKNEAIVHLMMRGGRWQLDRVYDRSFGNTSSPLRTLAEAHLAAHNIRPRPRTTPKKPYDAVRRMMGYIDPEGYDED